MWPDAHSAGAEGPSSLQAAHAVQPGSGLQEPSDEVANPTTLQAGPPPAFITPADAQPAEQHQHLAVLGSVTLATATGLAEQ